MLDVCLVGGDSVVVVARVAEADRPHAAAIDLVEAGPLTQPESASGLRTEVPAGSIRDVELTAGVALVALDDTFTDLEADAQVLAVAQLVCTLTAQRGVGQVRFTLNGTDIDVPRQNGSLTADPVTRDDYDDLIASE
jgi:spore germination protein GerM